MEEYREKCRTLDRLMDEYTKEGAAVAFSGGADSGLLLNLAVIHGRKNGSPVFALTAVTELHPAKDESIARKTALDLWAEHRVLRVYELKQGEIRRNPADRCYQCKKYLFQEIRKTAAELGVRVVLEGTNKDDLNQYRPGLRALEELEIKSPLKEAGFTKEEVRRLARDYGVPVADRPSAPCLATRFPYGEELTGEKLRKVEQGEEYLRSLGLYNLRLRVHGGIARIEADNGQMGLLVEKRREITGFLKELGYRYITLDLEGFRSGSMDEDLPASVRQRFGKDPQADRPEAEGGL